MQRSFLVLYLFIYRLSGLYSPLQKINGKREDIVVDISVAIGFAGLKLLSENVCVEIFILT